MCRKEITTARQCQYFTGGLSSASVEMLCSSHEATSLLQACTALDAVAAIIILIILRKLLLCLKFCAYGECTL